MTVTTLRGTSNPLSFSPWDKKLDATLIRARTQRRERHDTTHCDSVQRQAWCLKAKENLWMVESQRRSQHNLKSHWSNRIIIRSKTFSDRCSKTKKYFWATLGSSKDHRNSQNVMHMEMRDTTTTTASATWTAPAWTTKVYLAIQTKLFKRTWAALVQFLESLQTPSPRRNPPERLLQSTRLLDHSKEHKGRKWLDPISRAR